MGRRPAAHQNLWLATSGDQYELPLCVADTARELAAMLRRAEKQVWRWKKATLEGGKPIIKVYVIKMAKADADWERTDGDAIWGVNV